MHDTKELAEQSADNVGLSTVLSRLAGRFLQGRFARDAGVLAVANVARAGLAVVEGILVARWLGPDLYGVAALVMVYPNLVYTFFDARSMEASIKFLGEFHAQNSRERALGMCKMAYAIDIAIGLVVFTAVAASAAWASRRIAHRPEAMGLMIVYAAAFLPRALVGTSQAILSTFRRFSTVARLELVIAVVRVGLVLALILSGQAVSGVIWGHSAAMLVAGLGYGWIAHRCAKAAWGTSWLRGQMGTLRARNREIFAFVGYSELNALLGMVPKQLDVALLGFLGNPTNVGYYKLAKSVSSAISVMVAPLQAVAYPELSRLWALDNRSAIAHRVRRLALLVALPLGVVLMPVVLFFSTLIPLFVGEAFEPAIRVSQVLLVGSVVWLACFWLRPLYLARGDVRRWTLGTAAYSASFLLTAVLTVQRWGPTGLAVAVTGVTIGFHLAMGVLAYEARGSTGKPV